VTRITAAPFGAQVAPRSRETITESRWSPKHVGSALRNHHVWLTLGYVSLILLLARTYA
jgi:hypothetical protein